MTDRPDLDRIEAYCDAATPWVPVWVLCDRARTDLPAVVAYARRLEAENRRMHLAIRWALGEYGDFQRRDPKDGAFWWRNELRRRALLPAPETAATPRATEEA